MMRLESRQVKWLFKLVRFCFAGALFLASMTPFVALAQSTDDLWTDPLNLSRSGLALNPAFVIDSDGNGHVIWQDDLANYLYSGFDGEQWTAPQATNLDALFDLPTVTNTLIYSGSNPLLVPGPGEVFAFWLSLDGELFRSKAKNESFASNAGWAGRRLVASDVASFAVAADARGELHLAYLRTEEAAGRPAGIYYTRSKTSGSTWGTPVLLYESPYLRTLLTGEGNLSVATTGTDDDLHVFVAWDNRPRKQVFLAQSNDGGGNWEPLQQIAGPLPSSGEAGPFNIRVGANQSSVVLVWQNGLPGGACSQVYQASSDAGATWSDPQSMIQDLSGCARSNEFVTGVANSPEGPLYFLTETPNQIFLMAWDGKQWSQPQSQPILTGFVEPEIFSKVIFGCHRPSFFGDRLYVVGCDQGDGGDVWITSRDLASFNPPVWGQLLPVSSESLNLQAVDLVSTQDGVFHVFFAQPEDPEIYYTYWDGELWSRTSAIFESPEGASVWPKVIAGPDNELYLIARNDRGTAYFTKATSGDAASESRWAKPARLEIGNEGEVGSVDAVWDASRTLYIVYSVPVNEKRGIYLVVSKDHGQSWSEPLQVFDGTAAGFDIVGEPSLLISEDGLVHILWDQQSIQGDGVRQPLALYYARSEDGGQSFAEAHVIVDEPVGWREFITDGKGNLHLLWQPHNTLTVWDQLSSDGGRTWEYPQGLPDEGSLAAVTKDAGGRLQLVGVGPSALGNWSWDGGRWQGEASLGWTSSSQPEKPVQLLTTTVNNEGTMMVVLAMPTELDHGTQTGLFYSTRILQQVPKQNTNQKNPTPTTAAPTLVPATATAESLAVPTGMAASNATNSPSQNVVNQPNGPSSPFAMALVPVALLLISILGIVIWRASRDKDR